MLANGKTVQPAPRSCPAVDHNVRHEARTDAKFYVRADHAVWADFHLFAQFGARINDGG